jgi:hypothetical protein
MHSFDSFLILFWCRRHFCRLRHYEGGDEFPGVTGPRPRGRRLQTGATTRYDTQRSTRSNTRFFLKKELTRFGRDNDPPRQRGSTSRRAPIPSPARSGTLPGGEGELRFMEREVSFLERIEPMNLVEWSSFAPPRSVTAEWSDAPPLEVARWGDWFRLATCALIGEPRGFPLGRFVLFGSQPGTGVQTLKKESTPMPTPLVARRGTDRPDWHDYPGAVGQRQ